MLAGLASGNGNLPWNFRSIQGIPKVTHPWLVNILHAGEYRFTLRQWPKEADKTIVGVRAKIKIAGLESETLVPKNSKAVTFNLNLPAGLTELWTYIYDQNEKVGGAYFTEVEALWTFFYATIPIDAWKIDLFPSSRVSSQPFT